MYCIKSHGNNNIPMPESSENATFVLVVKVFVQHYEATNNDSSDVACDHNVLFLIIKVAMLMEKN